jgi:heme/copper-type cytochrome/quinol oxidase subunit 2
MIVPGFITDVRAVFQNIESYTMPCDEFCGFGHHAMAARETWHRRLRNVSWTWSLAAGSAWSGEAKRALYRAAASRLRPKSAG